VNWKTPEKRKSVRRLLSMIVVLHYTAVQVYKNRNLSYYPITVLTIQRAGRRHPFPDTNRPSHSLLQLMIWTRYSVWENPSSPLERAQLPSLKVKVKVETYEDMFLLDQSQVYTFEWQGGEQNSPHPHPLSTNSVQMSVNFNNFAELHRFSLLNLAILLILKRSFQSFYLNRSLSKVEKTWKQGFALSKGAQ